MLSHFSEGARLAPVEAEPQPQDLLLAFLQPRQEPPDLRRQQGTCGLVLGRAGRRIRDAFAKGGIALSPRRRQRDGLAREPEEVGRLRRRGSQLAGKFSQCGRPTQLRLETPPDGIEPASLPAHSVREMDRPLSPGYPGLDGLPDRPDAESREAEPLPVVELRDGAKQTDIALLNEVQQWHSRAAVPLGHRDDQREVGSDQLLGRNVGFTDERPERMLLRRWEDDDFPCEGLGGLGTLLDGAAQASLIGLGEKGDASDLDQIEREQIAREIVVRRSAFLRANGQGRVWVST